VIQVKHKGETRGSVRKSIRKGSVKHLNVVANLEKTHEVLMMTLKLLKELIPEANELVKMSNQVKKDTVAKVKKAPDKSILADKVVSESKRTLGRLMKVLKESPSLIKSLAKQVDFTQSIKNLRQKQKK
jgi:hypothetical protein